MKCVLNWIPLRICVRSRNTQPHLKGERVYGQVFSRFFFDTFSSTLLTRPPSFPPPVSPYRQAMKPFAVGGWHPKLEHAGPKLGQLEFHEDQGKVESYADRHKNEFRFSIKFDLAKSIWSQVFWILKLSRLLSLSLSLSLKKEVIVSKWENVHSWPLTSPHAMRGNYSTIVNSSIFWSLIHTWQLSQDVFRRCYYWTMNFFLFSFRVAKAQLIHLTRRVVSTQIIT